MKLTAHKEYVRGTVVSVVDAMLLANTCHFQMSVEAI